MEREMNKPTTKPVKQQRRGKTRYQLLSNGELWTAGKHGYHCGYVSDPDNLDYAIDVHEEEMHVLMEQARVEFGSM